MDSGGKFSGNEYVVYESPRSVSPLSENPTTVFPTTVNPSTEKPSTGKPLTENPTQLNKDISSKDISIPPNPPEGDGVPKREKRKRQRNKSQPETLPARFEGFWLFYREHMPPDRNAGNRQKAIRAWDNLAPDTKLADTLAKSLAKQVKTEAWQSGIGVPHASTWLNNRGWEDEWGPSSASVRGQQSSFDGEESVEWVY